MAVALLGNTNYITHSAQDGDTTVYIKPAKYSNYRVLNTGVTNVNLVVKDENTETTIVELEDNQMIDLVYDTAWRLSNTSSYTTIDGNLSVSGTINNATITGGTWNSTKSGYIDQDVSTAGTPSFQELFINSKLRFYYNSTNDSVVFAASNGVDTRNLIEFSVSMDILDGGYADCLDFIDRTIDGGDENIMSTYTEVVDGGNVSSSDDFWVYRLLG